MKKIFYSIMVLSLVSSCGFLEAPPDGSYTDENYSDYPEIVAGLIDLGYDCMCKHYTVFFFTKGDCCTDNGMLRDPAEPMSQMAHGTMYYGETNGDLYMVWGDSYRGINAANTFLHDDLGLKTRYFEDLMSDQVYKRTLQGDAYALRAWHHYVLLRQFGGVAEDGTLRGVPIMTEPVEGKDYKNYEVKRPTYDECMEQIIRDCDSALVYLPLANKDFLRETNETTVCTGAIRYRRFDRVSVEALKAFLYLAWASPSFCPDRSKALDRYDKAAQCAYDVIHHKMTKEYYKNVEGGYNPVSNFQWSDSDGPEVLLVSQGYWQTTVEKCSYPSGFNGRAEYIPSQELVDSYPDKYGYPITDPRSCYDPSKPYENRDPRFYSDIFYDGSQVVRPITGMPMYTFEIADNGKDAPGREGYTSPTGYYIKKFIYLNWNENDVNVDNGYRSVFYMRVNHMLGIFAEAANQVVGPLDETRYGMSAKEALAMIRRKTTNDGLPGLGINGDPYLDECANAGKDAFDRLVRNEWRVEFCWEGLRQFDLKRWGDLEHLNAPVHGVKITTDENGAKHYETIQADYRNFPSLWYPISYVEMRKSPLMLQNQGWEGFR